MDNTLKKLKSKFLKLRKLFKEYGNKCIYNHNGTCREPTMGWGSMIADTECRIDNCPFILYEEVK